MSCIHLDLEKTETIEWNAIVAIFDFISPLFGMTLLLSLYLSSIFNILRLMNSFNKNGTWFVSHLISQSLGLCLWCYVLRGLYSHSTLGIICWFLLLIFFSLVGVGFVVLAMPTNCLLLKNIFFCLMPGTNRIYQFNYSLIKFRGVQNTNVQ